MEVSSYLNAVTVFKLEWVLSTHSTESSVGSKTDLAVATNRKNVGFCRETNLVIQLIENV
jgi:hypothetical protein